MSRARPASRVSVVTRRCAVIPTTPTSTDPRVDPHAVTVHTGQGSPVLRGLRARAIPHWMYLNPGTDITDTNPKVQRHSSRPGAARHGTVIKWTTNFTLRTARIRARATSARCAKMVDVIVRHRLPLIIRDILSRVTFRTQNSRMSQQNSRTSRATCENGTRHVPTERFSESREILGGVPRLPQVSRATRDTMPPRCSFLWT